MSILVIGGDKIGKIESLIHNLGATRVRHWDSRRSSTCHKEIPTETDGIIMLTDFLSHNAMTHFKRVAKKRDIPYVCARRGTANVNSAFSKMCDECRGQCGRMQAPKDPL